MPFWPILQTTYFLTSVFFYCKNTRNFSYKTFVSILCIFRLRDSCAKKVLFSIQKFCSKMQAKKSVLHKQNGFLMVGVAGLEPAASWSRTKHTTKLCHTPIAISLYRMAERLSRFGSDFCRIFSKKAKADAKSALLSSFRSPNHAFQSRLSVNISKSSRKRRIFVNK